MIVPGGGISLDGQRWISSRPAFLLPVRVLGALFRRLFLTRLIELHAAGRLAFFGTQAGLADRRLLPASPRSGQEEAMGGLCQAAVHRPRGGARLSLALYPPGRHLEPAPDCVRRDRRHLPLQGLPPRWSGAAARHDARSRTSSSAASCSMSCHMASTASAITACSPVPPARPTSRVPANCLPWHRRRRLSSRQNHPTGSHPVPAAAAA